MKDRRRKIRTESGKTAKVRVTDGFAMRKCTIENQSEDGVCLKLDTPQFVEEQFVLLPSETAGPGRSCRVKWRRRHLVGAEFLGAKREGN